jgi:hypothetical protein
VAIVGMTIDWPAAAMAAGLVAALAGGAIAWMARSAATAFAAFVIAAVILGGLLARELVKEDKSPAATAEAPGRAVSAQVEALQGDLRGAQLADAQLAGVDRSGGNCKGFARRAPCWRARCLSPRSSRAPS